MLFSCCPLRFFACDRGSSSPYINRFLQPDTIIPGAANPQSWNRYSYVLNNPVRYKDPSGHKCVVENGYDPCSAKEKVLTNINYKFGSKVKIKNEKEWTLGELNVLNHTLNTVLEKFNNNVKAFHNAFGPLAFEMLPDWKAKVLMTDDAMAKVDLTGTILLRHNTIAWGAQWYGSGGWAIAHEMGHKLDMNGANGDPNLYFSNVFIETLNTPGACTVLGEHGCLGTNPDPIYWAQYEFLGKGLYQPWGQSPGYGAPTSSTEDYAQSFAAFVLDDPNQLVGFERESVIQIDIAVIVSYSE